jgi:hypothetical protein
MSDKPTTMKAEEAGRALEAAITDPRAPMTAADAATKSGLALRDAAQGLHWLTERYRGHLRVTEDGELIFLFPNGFTRPWVVQDGLSRALASVAHALGGVAPFVIRAWLLIVMVAYVVAFVAIVIGLMFARSEGSDRRGGEGGGTILLVLLRSLADALFWTFHPWSPLAMRGPMVLARDDDQGWRRDAYGEREERDETPFYEKVNRFVFGPAEAPRDPREMERRLVAQIRAGKGTIGLADVMRVTGLPREEADPLMARLLVDYEGDVEVSDEGGIRYRFEALRKSATGEAVRAPRAAWDAPVVAPPLTGNPVGSDVLIAAINGFNVVMSLIALGAGFTVSNVIARLQGVPLAKLPNDGTPIALGVVPLVFSLVILLMPAGRALLKPLREARAARERARLSVVRAVVEGAKGAASVSAQSLTTAWTRAAGKEPAPDELRRVVLDLGGEVEDRDDGELRYRFADLTAEARAVAQARREASDDVRAGPVVFTSEK